MTMEEFKTLQKLPDQFLYKHHKLSEIIMPHADEVITELFKMIRIFAEKREHAIVLHVYRLFLDKLHFTGCNPDTVKNHPNYDEALKDYQFVCNIIKGLDNVWNREGLK